MTYDLDFDIRVTVSYPSSLNRYKCETPFNLLINRYDLMFIKATWDICSGWKHFYINFFQGSFCFSCNKEETLRPRNLEVFLHM